MGDLRNKMKRILDNEERWKQIKAQQERDRAKPRGPRCKCGLTDKQTALMWQIGREIFCPSCLPAQYLGLVAMQVANLPDDLPE